MSALRIVCNDHQCTFEELLERSNFPKIHKRNLQKLAIEVFKVNNGLSLQLVIENFHFVENHFRHQTGTKSRVDHVYTENMARNLHHISDLKAGIPYRKK